MEPLCPQGGLAFWLGNLHREELTLDQLKGRGWCLHSKCYMCKGEEESENHIHLHCPKAKLIFAQGKFQGRLILDWFCVIYTIH